MDWAIRRALGVLFFSMIFAPDIWASSPVLFKNAHLNFERQNRYRPSVGRVFYVIQFDGPVQTDWKSNLEKYGIEFTYYIPENAFIAKIQSEGGWKAVSSNSHIQGIIPYRKEFRVSHDFESKKGREKVPALFELFSDQEVAGFLQRATQTNLPFVVESVGQHFVQIQTSAENISRFADIEGVHWVQPVPSIEPAIFSLPEEKMSIAPAGDYTDLTGYESGTKLMNFDGAYYRGLHGEGEVVAIADSGLDLGSTENIISDLKGQVLKGYTLGLFSTTWGDPIGHGTHTSGSIVGTGLLSHGRIHGGAYKAKLIVQGVWSPLSGGFSFPDLIKMFGDVRKKDGVHIHSDSWGQVAPPLPFVSIAEYEGQAASVDEASWKDLDLLIVFASGNNAVDLNQDGHIDPGSVSPPGTAKNCLTVGASKNLVLKGGLQAPLAQQREGDVKYAAEPLASSRLSDNPYGMAPFSGTGPTLDGRIKPDVVAPGTNIISTRAHYSNASTMWGIYNDSYIYAGGTSMATPLVTAAAALTRQYFRQIGIDNPSSALLKAALIHGTQDLYPGQFGFGRFQEFKTPRPNFDEGFGRVDVQVTTTLAKEKLIDETRGLRTGEVKTYPIHLQKGQRAHFTLVYTDAPASPGAEFALVNDLDLSVQGENGKVYYPNGGSQPDRLNNVEMVNLIAPEAGTYTVKITAYNVPQNHPIAGGQPFALILP